MSDAATPELRFPQFEGHWALKEVEESFPFIRNGFVGTATPYYREKGIPYFQGRNIQSGKLSQQADIYISEEFHLSKSKSQLKSGDMLMVQSGHVGHTAVYDCEDEANCHAVLVMTPRKGVEPYWFNYLFQSDTGRHEIYKIKTGNTIEHVLSTDVKKIILATPSSTEQKKIAAFLSAVDKKLAAVEAQLAGWRDFKRGMMQALFSQRLRFKVDGGSTFPNWNNVKLEESFSFHKTNSLSRAVLGLESDGIENIHYGDIHTKYRAQFDIRFESTGTIPNHLTDKAGEPLKRGDVVFADASEDYNDVGKAIEVINLDNRKVVAGLHTIVARPKKDTIALGFAAYLFASWPLRKQLMRIANGASVLGISKTNLANVDLTLPSLQEQKKIAEALSAIDAKIAALTQRLEATREFKRGLLQKMFV